MTEAVPEYVDYHIDQYNGVDGEHMTKTRINNSLKCTNNQMGENHFIVGEHIIAHSMSEQPKRSTRTRKNNSKPKIKVNILPVPQITNNIVQQKQTSIENQLTATKERRLKKTGDNQQPIQQVGPAVASSICIQSQTVISSLNCPLGDKPVSLNVPNQIRSKQNVQSLQSNQQFILGQPQPQPPSQLQQQQSGLKTLPNHAFLKPYSNNLRLRVTQLIFQNEISGMDKHTPILLNIGLKNFLKRIINQLLFARSNIRIHRNHCLQNSISAITSFQSSNLNDIEYIVSSNFTNPGMNSHNFDNNISFDNGEQRPNLNGTRTSNMNNGHQKSTRSNVAFSLRHLYNILYTNRSNIPVSLVYQNALNRTLIALSNVQYVSNEPYRKYRRMISNQDENDQDNDQTNNNLIT